MLYWGKHLLIDAQGGDLNAVTSIETITAFVDELVTTIDMVKYGPLWIERFATHDPVKAGISFVQMIETSNITGHFVDADGDFYLDIFSCKDYDAEVVQALVDQYFSPVVQHTITVNRDAKTNILERLA